MRLPSLGTQGLIGLAGGLICGAAIAASQNPTIRTSGQGIELVGNLWINAILMTIVPLVFSKLFISVAGNDDLRAVSRAGLRAAAIFIALLFATTLLAALTMPVVFSWLPIEARASTALRAGVETGGVKGPGPAEWLLEMVPRNALKAAADGAMVPLMVFAIAFAFAATRAAEVQRQVLVQFFRAVDATISVLLGWIVRLSPYGIFALAVGLSMKVGGEIVSALGYYIVVSSTALAVISGLLYLIVAAGTGIPMRRFASAAAPAQVVALSTHSSAASLPAMIEGAERLELSKTSTGFVLPLSLAVFKYSGPVWFVTVAFFVARLYDIPIPPSRVAPMVLISVATSFAIGGVPSGAAVLIAPVLVTAGLPLEAMAILLAVDPLPNAFRTVTNVTGMLAVTALCGARSQSLHEQPTSSQVLEVKTFSR